MTEKRSLDGMHISNGRHWYVERQIQASGQTGAVTVLHHLMGDDPTIPQWADWENIGWYIKLRHGWGPQGIPPAPKRLIHVRMYHPNWTARVPEEWAAHTVAFLSNVVAKDQKGNVYGQYDLWNDPFVTVSPANEQNLHYENGDQNAANQHLYETVAHYHRIADWNARWAREVDRLRPNRKATLCWPALAFGHEPPGFSPDGEYQIEKIRKAIALYEILATHPYALFNRPGGGLGTADKAREGFFFLCRDFRPPNLAGHDAPLGGAAYQFPRKPLLITESGTFAMSNQLRTEDTQAAVRLLLSECQAAAGNPLMADPIGVTWFIANSTGHYDNNIGENPALRDWFASKERVYTDAEIPVARPGGSGGVIVPVPGPPMEPPGEVPIPTPGPGHDGVVVDAERRRDAVAMAILRGAEDLHMDQGMQVNPESAFARAARLDPLKLIPTTKEFDFMVGGVRYTAQRWERFSDNLTVVFFAVQGAWDRIWYVKRGDTMAEDNPGDSLVSTPVGTGMDVSHWQGEIDWGKARVRGIDWAYIKATEGTNWKDPSLARNCEGAYGVGMPYGCYHFYRNAYDPLAQAEWFWENAGVNLPPVLDLEDTKTPANVRSILKCLQKIEDLFGEQPIIYTAAWWWTRERLGYVPWAKDYRLWVASYRTVPLLPADWDEYALHQYTAKGSGPYYGCESEYVDLNVVGDWRN